MDFKKIKFSNLVYTAAIVMAISAAVVMPISSVYADNAPGRQVQNSTQFNAAVSNALDGVPLLPGQTITIYEGTQVVATFTNNTSSPMSLAAVELGVANSAANTSANGGNSASSAVNTAANTTATVSGSIAAAQSAQAAMTA